MQNYEKQRQSARSSWLRIPSGSDDSLRHFHGSICPKSLQNLVEWCSVFNLAAPFWQGIRSLFTGALQRSECFSVININCRTPKAGEGTKKEMNAFISVVHCWKRSVGKLSCTYLGGQANNESLRFTGIPRPTWERTQLLCTLTSSVPLESGTQQVLNNTVKFLTCGRSNVIILRGFKGTNGTVRIYERSYLMALWNPDFAHGSKAE